MVWDNVKELPRFDAVLLGSRDTSVLMLSYFADYFPERRFHLTVRGYVSKSNRCRYFEYRANLPNNSYFVTELLGTDLHRLLTSRPLEKQFIQYFLYQILVSGLYLPLYFISSNYFPLYSVVSNTYTRPV